MRILSARFVNGRLDVPDGTLHEGDTVTVLVPEAAGTFEVTTEERALLEAAIAEMDRGEGVEGWGLLEKLKG